MKPSTPLALSGAIIAALCASSALAHHSNAMFDRQKVLDVTGTVHEFQWTNPHIWIELEVPSATGTSRYSIEGPTPGILRAKGWKFNTLKPGDKVTVKVHPLKDGSVGGGLISVTTAAGNFVYEAGSSNAGVVVPK